LANTGQNGDRVNIFYGSRFGCDKKGTAGAGQAKFDKKMALKHI
jgi:hypothetical protein